MSGGTYQQDFSSLGTNGSSIPWTNGTTLAGWYASRSVAPTDVTDYDAGTGSSTAGALYSFGAAGSTDRALGSLASGTQGDLAYGVRFVNDTGFDRTNIVVSYTGEQWRAANATVHQLQFAYRVGIALTNADARANQAWSSFSGLNFASPNTNSPQALNGNAATNKVAFNIALTGLIVPAGQELFLRWFDADDAGFDDGLAIDDLTVSFGQALTNAPPPPPPGTNAAFSMLTYNLKGNGASDWTTNAAQVQAIGRQLSYLDPDIIAFNEINNAGRTEMSNWAKAFLPGHKFVLSHGTDGFIRNGAASRFPITYWTNHLDGSSLTDFGYDGVFTRDLFEAQIAVPGFSQPLHLFVVHLKSGTSDSDDARRRAAEASAVSNFLVGFVATNGLHPYILAGDMNEDIAHPATGSQQPIQRLTSGTGLKLTTPLNPMSLSPLTHSIQNTNGLARRYDYLMPNALLFENIQSSQVFRTDLLNPVPFGLNTNDNAVASDHLPVLMRFNNPFTAPFSLTSIQRSNQSLSLTWQSVPGQSYRVEASSDLATWTTFADELVATNLSFTLITNSALITRQFRVKRLD